MLACTRIGAVHSVVFGGFSSDALRDRILDAQAQVVVTADGGWRRGRRLPSSPTSSRGARVAVRRARGGGASDRGRRHRRTADDRRPRPLVARADERRRPCRRRAAVRVRARAHGRRGPAVPPLHLGHHGRAQGDHAHHRRLPDPGGLHPPGRVRPASGDRRLLVRGRHRLGDRSQLHRLRTAGQRGHLGHVRGHARLSRQGPVVVDHRALRGHHPLHRPHRHPHLHEVGRPSTRAATTSPRCGSSARWASPSTPRRGSGTAPTSAGAAARWSTPGGRPRPEPS